MELSLKERIIDDSKALCPINNKHNRKTREKIETEKFAGKAWTNSTQSRLCRKSLERALSISGLKVAVTM